MPPSEHIVMWQNFNNPKCGTILTKQTGLSKLFELTKLKKKSLARVVKYPAQLNKLMLD